ncbi:hypothetical protein [Nonomuraea sp. NPDC049480]|uniref:hypothetical protein n=1 Tax=Nonomuraea sp. NPDC049480 TaxID=3364353 RepID=UPI0037A27DA1
MARISLEPHHGVESPPQIRHGRKKAKSGTSASPRTAAMTGILVITLARLSEETMRRLIATLITAGTITAGLAAVTAGPSAADSVRITGESPGTGTDNRDF